MGFDVARAALEAFQSRLPFLDRLLSYLYFADLDVLEESTWDEFGHGVTVLGRRGPDVAGRGVIVAAPLPRAGTLAGLAPDSPDCHRAGTLLALAWAVASLEDAELRAPVTLVAARPDPLGTGLRSVLNARITSGQTVIAAAPTGPSSVTPACAIVVLSIETRVPVQPLRAPLRDVVTLAAGGASHPGAVAALARLEAAFRDRSIEPLELHSAPGVHLAEPDVLRITVGLRTAAPDAPEGWHVVAHPGSVGGTGSLLDRFLALNSALARATSEVREAWDRTGRAAPADGLRIVDIGSVDPSTGLLALGLPAGAASPGALDGLASRISAVDGVRCSVVHAFVPEHADDGASGTATVLDTASCLLGHVSRVTALGPRPGDLSDDPPSRIREWGSLYRDALRSALDPSPRRRSP